MSKLGDLVNLVLATLNQMGATLMNIDSDKQVPTYYVQLDKDKLLHSVDDTLKSIYGILWTLTYGKITDENRNEVIRLEYKIKE